MKVVADSQSIFWYVTDNSSLSDAAGAALDDAFATDGIGIPAASLLDLWYSTHKKGPSRIEPRHYESVKRVLEDESFNVYVIPFAYRSVAQAESFPRNDLPDPFDRMIVAAALENDLPLVTSDKRITELAVVPIIW